MDNTIRSTILRTVGVVRRRYLLLVVPFLIMLPLSVVGAVFLGGGYAARSLVMLQESVATNPLARDTVRPNADGMALMLRGLRALLASDYVLAPIVEEGTDGTLDPATRAARLKDLARDVSVDLLGNDFLEFRLLGPSPQGLGDKLQRIMSNLIGALVAPPGERAGLYALRALQERLTATEQQAAAIDARLASGLPEGLAFAEARLVDTLQLKREIAQDLAGVDRTAGDRAAGGTAEARPAAEAAGEAGSAAASSSVEALRRQLDGVSGQAEALSRRVAEFRQAQTDKAALEATASSLRTRLAAEKARFGGEGAASWGSVLNAPERMIVVDPPKDPSTRASSRLKLAASGVFGGLLLGVALVVLAEVLDTTLHSTEQMIAVAGVPCLAALPPLAARSGRGGLAAIGVSDVLSLPNAPRRLGLRDLRQ